LALREPVASTLGAAEDALVGDDEQA